MKKWLAVALIVLGALVLGATVLREPIASAAQLVNANIVGPLDGQGNVSVHEQGTANVNVTNSSLPVTGSIEISPIPLPVTATPKPTQTHFQKFQLVGGDPAGFSFIFGRATANESLAVTSLTAENGFASEAAAVVLVVIPQPADGRGCVPDLADQAIGATAVNVPGSETVHLEFPEPLVLSSGNAWCAALNTGASFKVVAMTVVGYTF